MTTAALVLVAGMVTMVGAEGASAAVKAATGTITCTSLKGSVTFTPALKLVGTPSVTTDTAKVAVTAKGCTTSGSNIPIVSKGVATAKIVTTGPGANAFTNLLTSKMLTFKVLWYKGTAQIAKPSVITMSGYDVVVGTGGVAGFSIPQASGGSSLVTGSFAGNTHSSATAYTTLTQGQLGSKAASSTGLAKVSIGSGSFAVK
jgi:hypothetical protein